MNKSITRRILALSTIGCFLGVGVFLCINGVAEAWGALSATASVVIGFYFGVKANGI